MHLQVMVLKGTSLLFTEDVTVELMMQMRTTWWMVEQQEKRTWKWKSLSRVWLCDPMDCTAHGILQARILEWVAVPFSRGSSQPRDWTQVSHTAGGLLTSWATREVPKGPESLIIAGGRGTALPKPCPSPGLQVKEKDAWFVCHC